MTMSRGQQQASQSYNDDSKSAASHKSTQSSRSSVLERARAYNRRVEHEEQSRRAKSMERGSDHGGGDKIQRQEPQSPRSQSAGRNHAAAAGNRASTRERAMASVRQESSSSQQQQQQQRPSSSSKKKQQQQQQHQQHQHQRPDPITHPTTTAAAAPRRDPDEAVVSPELLVDALSGHEDGLLAIAERLMEHYDAGYDVMGEAIIDAFADVQKLFQHVVEAAHMEGAAFEASRRESEMVELRAAAASNNNNMLQQAPSPTNNNSSTRHDEFIDEDVKDALTDAIRTGAPLRDVNQHDDCLALYEAACQNASSMLPVDSDHRGRLQLSIARAESMAADRACAILRYAMDDVLRSGLRPGKEKVRDLSKRSDMVLSKPKDLPSLTAGGAAGVVHQSSEEALASLVEEMKEVLGAPVYERGPLQGVAGRFWGALGDAQRNQQKNEERLEQALGKLKGEYLLSRAEWEEKLTASQDQADTFKKKYIHSRDTTKGEMYLDQARSLSSKWGNSSDKQQNADEAAGVNMNMTFDSYGSRNNNNTSGKGPGSVVSISSGLAQSARQIVGSFNCSGMNDRSGTVVASELASGQQQQQDISHSFSGSRGERPPSKSRRGRSSTRRGEYQGGQQQQQYH